MPNTFVPLTIFNSSKYIWNLNVYGNAASRRYNNIYIITRFVFIIYLLISLIYYIFIFYLFLSIWAQGAISLKELIMLKFRKITFVVCKFKYFYHSFYLLWSILIIIGKRFNWPWDIVNSPNGLNLLGNIIVIKMLYTFKFSCFTRKWHQFSITIWSMMIYGVCIMKGIK